jgi:hypothetical protein
MRAKTYSRRRKIAVAGIMACAGLMPGCAPGTPTTPSAAVSRMQNSAQEGAGRVVAKFDRAIALDQPTVTVNFPLPTPANSAVVQASSNKSGRVLLNLKGIDYKQNPGAGYEIYLNQPAGAPGDRNSAHYAGVLHFYGLKEAAQASGQPAEIGFDITEQVRQLVKTRQWQAGELTVTFVRSGVRPPAGSAESAQPPDAIPRISSVEIVVE